MDQNLGLYSLFGSLGWVVGLGWGIGMNIWESPNIRENILNF